MTKVKKLDKKKFANDLYNEENISLRDVKRTYEHKKYRNFDNMLRSKDVNALLEYEDDFD